jgi:drug/metabolite transporter (DMT)-like permease
MYWMLFAFAGPVLWAISTHLDKYLVERFFKDTSVAVLLVFTALLGLVLLPVIWVYRPEVTLLPLSNILIITFSGLLYMGALLFYLQALQSEEASVVAPFFQASPLFGYVLGYVALGETLSAMQKVGGAVIVGGTLLLSVRPRGTSKFKLRLVVLMLACAFCLSLTSLIFKIFAIRDEFWTTTFWTFVGQAIFGAVILLITNNRRQFIELLRTNTTALLTINGSNELINLGGGLSARYALLFAPLSLVQAITSTTTLFVFVFGVGISIFFPALGREQLSGWDLVKKGLAATLIGLGVMLISR